MKEKATVSRWWEKIRGKIYLSLEYAFYVSNNEILCEVDVVFYTGCPNIDGITMEGVMVYEKISRKYRIHFFHSRLCFRENRF